MIFQSGEHRRHCNTFEKSSTLVRLYFSANSFSSSVPNPSLHNTRDNSKREPNSCVNLCCFTPIKRKITNCSNWNGSSRNDLKLPVSLPLTFMWGPLLTKKVQKKKIVTLLMIFQIPLLKFIKIRFYDIENYY